MPAQVERCVAAIMKDPKFKPMKGRTKEQSAWAVCNAKYNEQKATIKELKKRSS